MERAIFRIPTAKIILGTQPVDSENNQHFASESDDFIPGVEIEIKLGYGSNNETVFHGIIVKQGIRNLTGMVDECIIHCRDQNDHLKDWDLIVARAEANGMLMYAENGEVSVKKPMDSGIADLKVAFGKGVVSYDYSIGSRIQAPAVPNAAWDFETQFLGTITILGNATLKLNTLLELNGFGEPFNGNALITSILHAVREGIWHTTVGFGLPSKWRLKLRAVSAKATGSLKLHQNRNKAPLSKACFG
ncbi:MAG: hypothetical protein NW218_10865 [Saprospiraceae bacterium]|nr:hypothetical protein [Saprospiraceae bacterium]